MLEVEGPRQEYAFVAVGKLDRAQADRLCQEVLDRLRPQLELVEIDAYTDYTDELSPKAAAAQAWLRERGQQQRGQQQRGQPSGGDPGMGLQLDPSDDRQWKMLAVFAAWSIHTDLWGGYRERDLGSLHDCARSVAVALNGEDLAVLSHRLEDLGSWVLLTE